jgi:hypothetical protein
VRRTVVCHSQSGRRKKPSTTRERKHPIVAERDRLITSVLRESVELRRTLRRVDEPVFLDAGLRVLGELVNTVAVDAFGRNDLDRERGRAIVVLVGHE